MSTLTDYEWAQKALNCLYLELPAPVASDCIPKLKRMLELYDSDNARLRKAIEEVEPPECQYPNLCKASHGHIEVCKYIEFQEWKRNALEGK